MEQGGARAGRRSRAPLVVAAVVAVLVVGGVWFVRDNLGRWLSSSDPFTHVDVIVVPAGDPEYRIETAFDLAERGLTDQVWVAQSSEGTIVSEPEAVLDEAERRGLEDRVTLLGITTSIPADARATRRVVERRFEGAVDIGVVTTPWNVARARLTFSRILGGRADVHAWAAGGAPYDADRWWVRDAETTWTEATKLVGTLFAVGQRPSPTPPPIGPGRAAAALGGGLVAAFALGWACRLVAPKLGIVTVPRLWRSGEQARPVPLLGGLALLGGALVGVVLAGRPRLGPTGVAALTGVVVLAVIGVIDDLTGIGARARLLWAAGAGGAAWLMGLRATVLPDVMGAEVVNALVTVGWFMGITHAMNLLDHLDGSAAGTGAASAVAIAAVAVVSGQSVVAVAAGAVAGACLGYLVHNVHPARLYMGDMGALALGFAIAALALALHPPQRPPLSMGIAALVAAIPIIDVTLVTLSRVRSGVPVSVGGTDHSTHRLVQRGLSPRRATAVLWTAQLVFGGGAVAIAATSRAWGWALALVFAGLALGTTAVLLRSPPMPVTPYRPAELLEATERALEALRSLDGDGGTLRRVDAASAKAVRATAERLERVRRRLAD